MELRLGKGIITLFLGLVFLSALIFIFIENRVVSKAQAEAPSQYPPQYVLVDPWSIAGGGFADRGISHDLAQGPILDYANNSQSEGSLVELSTATEATTSSDGMALFIDDQAPFQVIPTSSYTISNLPPGGYYVQVPASTVITTNTSFKKYQQQFYSAAPNRRTADIVNVLPGQVTANINFQLYPEPEFAGVAPQQQIPTFEEVLAPEMTSNAMGSISGTITDIDNTSTLKGAKVQAIPADSVNFYSTGDFITLLYTVAPRTIIIAAPALTVVNILPSAVDIYFAVRGYPGGRLWFITPGSGVNKKYYREAVPFLRNSPIPALNGILLGTIIPGNLPEGEYKFYLVAVAPGGNPYNFDDHVSNVATKTFDYNMAPLQKRAY